ncbi:MULTISPECIES: GapS6a family protein [Pasteurella]|uniref:GapS6a family protein n=1 Tax=Pasteurella TaxID=745 RepID=UPI00076D5D6F|nr:MULTISPECIES: hypothetical protein [Pasteurella]AMM82859.1 hypothetical protein AW43_10870 [Pasteurella multocida subsp. multocida PMTB2.1]APW57527.1 hypothetical protein BV212_04750 [Pasteurella multocida]ATC20965.1 hypothetical protein CLD33_02410 [Pasteurella multocida]AXQ72364.1 hypothetical protein AWY89_05055 [Pasteurella multocida subsp. multocida]KWW10222.1 hypothetical protein VM82_06390 [Pasteurella multocida]
MEYLTATILAGLLYDGFKNGSSICYKLLKSKLQGWIIDDNQLNKLVSELKKAGVNEDLASHVIERKINEHPQLTEILKNLKPSNNNTGTHQISNIGHNINNHGNSSIFIGNITINKDND